MQLKNHYEDGCWHHCNIPNKNELCIDDILWGDSSELFTPAYWKYLSIIRDAKNNRSRYKLGNSLLEETIACLLGGHGIRGEVGTNVFRNIKRMNLLNDENPSIEKIHSCLLTPVIVNGGKVKYRFPKQKSKYIYHAINHIRHNEAPSTSGIELRDWLTIIPGIGYKTASWIARNHMDADDVAILDIHIHRAGVIAGFLSYDDNIDKNYLSMEKKFIDFSNAISLPASILDNIIWNEMRCYPRIVHKLLQNKGVTNKSVCGLPHSKNRRSNTNYDLFIKLK